MGLRGTPPEGNSYTNERFSSAIIFHQRRPSTTLVGMVHGMEVCPPTKHEVIVREVVSQEFIAMWENLYKKWKIWEINKTVL